MSINMEGALVLAIAEKVCTEAGQWIGRTSRGAAKERPSAANMRGAFQMAWGIRAEIRKRVHEQLKDIGED